MAVPVDTSAALALLRDGELEIAGRLVDASNATFYGRVRSGPAEAGCVYKPLRGERPLWDFPDGTLAGREVAAYVVSEAGGWAIVPPTLLRSGPFGPGMCQLWIDVDESVDVVALVRSDDPRLRRIALFDAVVNNADRKGGHLLPTPDGQVFGVDHGVCFHEEDKLRTLLWGWRGSRFTAAERATLVGLRAGLAGAVGSALADLLTPRESVALGERVDRLLRRGVFPAPAGDWPAIPWPPF
ncbi:MAG: SCO1664 family protein [Mycobacteriales bacterium]